MAIVHCANNKLVSPLIVSLLSLEAPGDAVSVTIAIDSFHFLFHHIVFVCLLSLLIDIVIITIIVIISSVRFFFFLFFKNFIFS